MTSIASNHTQRDGAGSARVLRQLDYIMGCVVLIWMAEALVRFDLGTIATLIAYAYFAARFLMTLPKFLPATLRLWPMLLYPGVCMVSVYWSLVPMASAIAAIQIAFTILIGVFLGLQFSLCHLAGMITLALGITMIASLGNLGGQFGTAYSWEGGFLGIYTNKNALGQRAAVLVLTCLFMIVSSRGRILAVCLLLIALVLLFKSRSATAVLLSSVCCCGFLVSHIVGTSRQLRPVVWLAGIVSAAIILTLLIGLGVDPIATVLEAFGKNATLTGRSILWQHGLEKITEAPLLGQGAMAYWVAPEYAQETEILRRLYGTTVSAFHNFIVEILVMLGPLGLLAMLTLIATSFAAVIRLPAMTERRWAIWLLVLLIALSLLGSSLYRQHEITLLLVVAIGASAQRHVLLAPAGRAVRTG